jgi:hypothetical protein
MLMTARLEGSPNAKQNYRLNEVYYDCGCKYRFNHEIILEHICSEHEAELISKNG